MTRDWVRWHEAYADPGSGLARRLTVVRGLVREAVQTAPGGSAPRVAVMCAGEGRDVLPVLAESARGRAAEALLVELHPGLAQQARETAAELGLSGVTVRTGDAGIVAEYAGVTPVDLLLACGVFGNTTVADAHRTIAAMPALLADGAVVIWTRGRDDDVDRSVDLRERFAGAGFREERFVAPDDAHYRVGMHRLPPRGVRREPVPERMFSFV